jgi:hypothetical protein
MPAQKRRHESPSPKPRDNVAASSAAAGGGVGEGGGRPPRRRLTDPRPEREEDDGELELSTAQRRGLCLTRCAHVALYVSVWIWLRGSCASMGLADSDADGGGALDDGDSSKNGEGGNDE